MLDNLITNSKQEIELIAHELDKLQTTYTETEKKFLIAKGRLEALLEAKKVVDIELLKQNQAAPKKPLKRR